MNPWEEQEFEDVKRETNDLIRAKKNEMWLTGGVKAVNDFELSLRTCYSCGFVHESVLVGVCICGKSKAEALLERLDDLIEGDDA